MSKILIAGAGAAGMMAGIAAAENGHEVHIYEKNEKPGRKLFITGKGRCNVTNYCDTDELFDNIVTNRKFMFSSIYSFDNSMVYDFFEKEGCPLKVERGKRVFPVSDKSYDVIDALRKALVRLGADINLSSCVEDIIIKDNKSAGLKVNGKTILADKVLIATGGYSYPSTGSTGDGHQFARRCGHKIIECMPSLVPFNVKEEWIKKLQGLSLKNCRITIYDDSKIIYEDFGELLFTHYGVSGPVILSASSHTGKLLKEKFLRLSIDLKPALDERMLDERILKDFGDNVNRIYANSLDRLFPKSLIPVVIMRSGIQHNKKVNEITKDERKKLVRLIKNFDMTLTGIRGFDEAVITHGGVSVKEIDPYTMESKLIKNLYFAGEIIDVDAVTGGFNLQIAWSTGHLAGSSM